MKTLKKAFLLILIAIFIISLLQTGIITSASIMSSGKCGENLTWTLDGTGKLTISGIGDMYNYNIWENEPFSPWGTSIITVVINPGVTSIGDNAFSDCANLTSIIIPDSLKRIGYEAFIGCTSLFNFDIPDNITIIDSMAFYNTGYSNNASNWDNNLLYLNNWLIDTNERINGDVSIKHGTLGIACGAFSGRFSITSVAFPNTTEIIGREAFSDCFGIKSVILSNTLKEIGKYAFISCENLTSVAIPKSVSFIDDGAFYDCTHLTLKVFKNSYAHQYATNNNIPYDIIKKNRTGDPDGDGIVSVGDALAALRVAARLTPATTELIACCDIDGDGIVSVSDALAILRVAAKLAPPFEDDETDDEPALKVAYPDFNGYFSPFFSVTAEDCDVQAMTQVNLLTSDRTGTVIEKGINGTTVNYNGTDYIYYGPADLEIIEKADGYVDYMITLRKDVRFSDGTYVTIDDVIFTMYVLADPAYNGTLSFNMLPIDGINEYRAGWITLNAAIFYAGIDNTDFTFWTQEQQTEFWEKYVYAIVMLAQEIVDYCVTYGYAEEGDVSGAAAAWGFSVPEGGTIEDFAIELASAYGPDVATMISIETAGSTVDDLFPGYDTFSQTAVKTGASADRIKGIKRTGDYSVTITMTQVDATALYSLCIPIAPMHYYGNSSDYYYARNKFGFNKGELSSIGAKTSAPMGAGPYKFVSYEDGVISFEANEYYYRGEPKTKVVKFVETYADVTGLVIGDYDIASPSFSDDAVDCIKKANSNGELCGDKIETATVDNLGYGYIGMCANVMNVGGDPASDASKSLRKAFATIFSLFRDDSIDAYYGDRASIINYPISKTSWAAPQPADDGYKVAFSVDKDGNDIYTDGMSAVQKCEAAKTAALGFFEAAGYTVSGGKVIAAPAGASLEYTAWIPADGCGDHPSFMILVEAKKALADIGITLIINDLTNSSDLWTGLEYQEVAIWCAAWGASVDPDMYQLHFSGDDTHAPGGSNYMYCINDSALNKLILDGRSSTDQAYRKGVYKACLDIIIDWAVEVPVYQRQNAVIFSTERVDLDTVAHDITPFYGWLNEVANIVMN